MIFARAISVILLASINSGFRKLKLFTNVYAYILCTDVYGLYIAKCLCVYFFTSKGVKKYRKCRSVSEC